MEKTKKAQEQKPMNEHHLKTTRYNGAYFRENEKKPTGGKKVPDAKNPKRLKELH